MLHLFLNVRLSSLEGPLHLLENTVWVLARHPDTAGLGHSPYTQGLSLPFLPEIGPSGALDGSLMVHAHAHTLTLTHTPTPVCPEDLGGSFRLAPPVGLLDFSELG